MARRLAPLVPLVAALAVARGDELLDAYFGAGCFWHVQKVVNLAEEAVLGRFGRNLTGITGYAGGNERSPDICYTNYGDLGHTEVVLVRGVPRSRLPDFVRAIWPQLFTGGDRSDNVNRGPSYRAALGVPGGASGAIAAEVMAAQPSGHVASFEAGAGDEPDTLGKRVIIVYDAARHPVHQAELYHQFHDYGGMHKDSLVASGALRDTGCPSELAAMFESPIGIALAVAVALFCLCFVGAWYVKVGRGAPCRRAGAASSTKVTSSNGAVP